MSREKLILEGLINKRGVNLMDGIIIDRALRDSLEGENRKKLKDIKNKLIDLLQLNPLTYDTVEMTVGYDVMEEKSFVLIADAWDIIGEDEEEGEEKVKMLIDDIKSILEEVGVSEIELEESDVSPRIMFSF